MWSYGYNIFKRTDKRTKMHIHKRIFTKNQTFILCFIYGVFVEITVYLTGGHTRWKKRIASRNCITDTKVKTKNIGLSLCLSTLLKFNIPFKKMMKWFINQIFICPGVPFIFNSMKDEKSGMEKRTKWVIEQMARCHKKDKKEII